MKHYEQTIKVITQPQTCFVGVLLRLLVTKYVKTMDEITNTSVQTLVCEHRNYNVAMPTLGFHLAGVLGGLL